MYHRVHIGAGLVNGAVDEALDVGARAGWRHHPAITTAALPAEFDAAIKAIRKDGQTPELVDILEKGRRLLAESLEPRRLLATFAYSGSALSVGLDAAATLSMSSSGNGEYVLSLAGGALAIVVAHWKVGFFVFKPGQGWEYCASIAVTAVAVGTVGAGRWSLDQALGLQVTGWWGLAIAAGLGVGAAALQLAVSYRPEASK